jgi:predicted double-glycine peptidase
VLADTAALIRNEQAQAAAREQLLRQEILAVRQRLEQFLGMVRIAPSPGSAGGGPR